MVIFVSQKESIFPLFLSSREDTSEHNSTRNKTVLLGISLDRSLLPIHKRDFGTLVLRTQLAHQRMFALVVAQESLNSLEKSLFAQSSKHWAKNVTAFAKPLLDCRCVAILSGSLPIIQLLYSPRFGPDRTNGAWSAHVTQAERSVVIGRKRSSSYNGSWTARVESYLCLICVRSRKSIHGCMWFNSPLGAFNRCF